MPRGTFEESMRNTLGKIVLAIIVAAGIWGFVSTAERRASEQNSDSGSAFKDQPIDVQRFTDEEVAASLKGAMRGNYQDQRNAAYMLSQGSSDQRVSSCAWRVVIISSGHKDADATDEQNMKLNCGALPESAREDAKLRAIRLIQQIASS